MRHFIDTQQFTASELHNILELIRCLKEAYYESCVPQLLANRTLGMIFEEPSTRTRISFEVAMAKLGGHALYLKPGEIHLGERETVADTARVVSSMCDMVMARTLKHETLLEIARHSTVPVINGLTDFNHPTQAVCDVFTMRECLPEGKALSDLQVTFIGDATNVCSSLLFITTQLGMRFVQAAPQVYQCPHEWAETARENCKASGGSFETTEDPVWAVKNADFIYTDLWWWIGQEEEIPDRMAAFMPRYQVTDTLLTHAPGHSRVMHCLPASRNVEATDQVLDGPQSIIFRQAENRLHTEMALLLWMAGALLQQPSEEARRQHRRRIENCLGG